MYDPTLIDVPGEVGVAFENHVNFFHEGGQGLDPVFAKGLSRYLNSTLVDRFFRQFSGHTQVNAGDLAVLPYPSRSQLEAIGVPVLTDETSQHSIDGLVEAIVADTSSNQGALNMDDPKDQKREEALDIFRHIGMPKQQQNDRSAHTLLALLDVTPEKQWKQARAHEVGIHGIMEWIAKHYGVRYAENTRETIRRETLHQLVHAAVVEKNPDDPTRAINSPKTVYRASAALVGLVATYGQETWAKQLASFLYEFETLRERYATVREKHRVDVEIAPGLVIALSAGGQNPLIKRVIEEFVPQFVRKPNVLYVGDAKAKQGVFDEDGLKRLGLRFDRHGQMPDVIVLDGERRWLILVEAVTSHGPMNAKRVLELKSLFRETDAGLVFVTAFEDRRAFNRFQTDIAWETEVWIAEDATHLIHYNGERFLGPHTAA